MIRRVSQLVLVALLITQYVVTKEVAGNAIAETLSETFADSIKESTPKVEHTGGVRQQVLHKGADIAAITAVNKGTAVLALSALKYPALAMAAPVALPVVKVVAAGMLMNALHQHINNLNKKGKDGEPVSEEDKKKEEAQEERGKVAGNLMEKITGAFTKTQEAGETKKSAPEAKESKKADAKDEKKSE